MATGKFHSALYSNFPAPGQASSGDIWFATDQGLTYWSDFEGNLHELGAQVPYPTLGGTGPAGPQGADGASFIGQTGYYGTWLPSPQTYTRAAVVSYLGFNYLCLSDLNISDNMQAPAGNPFWKLLGPTTASGRTSAVICTVDGAGAPPSLGFKAYFQLPFACTVSGFSILANAVGSAEFDVKWCSFANFPSAVSIVGASNPALVSQQSTENLDVSALWSPITFNQGDILEVNLLSITTITILTLSLAVTTT